MRTFASFLCTIFFCIQVISPKGKKTVTKIVSAERGQTISVVCCMSASGVYVPPGMIFPRVRMKPELFNDAPIGTCRMVSESGYMNSTLFLQWLQHLKDHTYPSEKNPLLLILDNHKSHCTLEAIEFCRTNHIILLGLPPHCSHKIQPLDRTFFFALKSAYSQESDKWMTSRPGEVITQSVVAKLFCAAYNRVCTPEKAMNGFLCTGIWPFNPDVFSEEDFSAAAVTDRE